MKQRYYKYIGIIFLLLGVNHLAFGGQTFTAKASGNWNAAIWTTVGAETFPQSSTDIVIIPATFTVTINGGGTTDQCGNITISGTLSCTAAKNLTVFGNFVNNGTLSLSNGTIIFFISSKY
jgi:hypothetical protein